MAILLHWLTSENVLGNLMLIRYGKCICYITFMRNNNHKDRGARLESLKVFHPRVL